MDDLCYHKVNTFYRGDDMELGEKLRAARLEAGLSQRQLCGDTITRNMLSQIENGTANPSYATLQALCARLGKPVSYFREDAPSENLAVLHQAEQAEPAEALEILKSYLQPDPILDSWYHRLKNRCLMALAEQAVTEKRMAYARQLLQQAEPAAEELRKWILLCHMSGMDNAQSLCAKLPDNTEECYLRAQAAWEQGNYDRCLAHLTAADRQPEKLQLLKGQVLMEKKEYQQAVSCLLPLEQQVYPLLEICYRELGDFEKAYEYACKQRGSSKN